MPNPSKGQREKLGIDDSELEEKPEALVKGDILGQGQSSSGCRSVYEKDIREFDAKVIREEYSEELKKEKKRYNPLLGKYNSTWIERFLRRLALICCTMRLSKILDIPAGMPADF